MEKATPGQTRAREGRAGRLTLVVKRDTVAL